LLFVVVCCCLLLFVVVCCCLLLFVVVCCCLLLFVVVFCCFLLFFCLCFRFLFRLIFQITLLLYNPVVQVAGLLGLRKNADPTVIVGAAIGPKLTSSQSVGELESE